MVQNVENYFFPWFPDIFLFFVVTFLQLLWEGSMQGLNNILLQLTSLVSWMIWWFGLMTPSNKSFSSKLAERDRRREKEEKWGISKYLSFFIMFLYFKNFIIYVLFRLWDEFVNRKTVKKNEIIWIKEEIIRN